MKIAVVYNRESQEVINLFGIPNRERIGLRTIEAIVSALKAGGHRVASFEGDRNLIDRLEEFMPRVVKGERPGMVFNVSYGIQGQARYTHVPSILEMVGIPYVGSGPLAHSLALDKVVTKMVLRQHDLPTPDFAVLHDPASPLPSLAFPLIVKPKNEAVSLGLRVVRHEDDLADAVSAIFRDFQQPVLVERYIDGPEINVGILGNDPAEAFPPVALTFDEEPRVYTYDDKTGRSGRTVGRIAPAPLDRATTERVQEVSRAAFRALGCSDCARVDLRLDQEGCPYILEINSLPALSPDASYTDGAAAAGLDHPTLVNRLVEVASTRYFGTPHPPTVRVGEGGHAERVFTFLTERRDRLESRVASWTDLSSRTGDAVGLRAASHRLERTLREVGLVESGPEGDHRSASLWTTPAGVDEGTLLVVHLDVPLEEGYQGQRFRKDSSWLYGEGVGVSRAPLAMLEYALRALAEVEGLSRIPLGVLFHLDEGRDARYSAAVLRAAAERAARVFVLRPGNPGDRMILQRRGRRRFALAVEGRSRQPGEAAHGAAPLEWALARLRVASELGSPGERTAVDVQQLRTEAYPLRLPHRIRASLVLSYRHTARADRVEAELREVLSGGRMRSDLHLVSDRLPMRSRKRNRALFDELRVTAAQHEIPLEVETSRTPSTAGSVPRETAVVCGVGPVARDLHTPQERVSRVSLIQRTLLLAQHLLRIHGEKG
jgi:D-alanine-D-alanine ligase